MQTQESQESQESQPKQRLMYGDLVNGVTTVVFLPFYIHQAMAHSFALDPDRINNTPCSSIGPWFICCTTAIYAVCCIISWLRVSDNSCQNTASWLAFGGNIATFIGTNQTQWPHPHKELVLVQLMWQLLMVTANKGHLRRTKLLMGLLAVATALFNSATAPMVETVTGASVTGAALGNLPEHGPTILGTAGKPNAKASFALSACFVIRFCKLMLFVLLVTQWPTFCFTGVFHQLWALFTVIPSRRFRAILVILVCTIPTTLPIRR
jgi:hypothetical protein